MSPITTQLAVLALASSALAIPYAGHAKHHRHFFHGSAVSGTGAPYGLANATGIWGTGTGASSGFASATGLATGFSGPSPVGPETASSEVAAAETSTCTDSVVRVTHTNRVTVTVQASGAANSSEVAAVSETSSSVSAYNKVAVTSSSSASSSSAAPSLSLDLQNKGYHNNRKSKTTTASSSAAQTTSSSVYVAPTSTSSSSSTLVVASVSVASSSAVASSTASATSSSASSTSTSTSSGSGKRGVAYNDASLTTCFEDSSEVTWGYNWGSSSSGLSSTFNYVPLLWGTSSTFTDVWTDAADDAISNGATHLMAFNEPDMTSQSNLSPEDAAAAYKTYMMPYASKAKLGAPAVTNGGGDMGLTWLSNFIDACDGCQIDFVSIHWYDSASNSAYFKEQVQNATDISGGKPVWVTEFGCTSGSDSDISSFLEEVMPWMDGQDFVERYSYFMVADGYLVSGTEPSTYGSTYSTYTSS